MPALVRIESLGPFFKTLAADDRYSRKNMQNFSNNFKRHYLKNKRFFLQFLLLLSNPTLNLEHFDKKMWVS